MIGIIGFGVLGETMARRLKTNECEFIVFDHDSSKKEQVLNGGFDLSHDIEDLIQQSSFIVSCLPGPSEVNSILSSVERANPGTVYLETSTVGPNTVKTIGERLKQKSIRYLDAPISRGRMKHGQPTITVWVGGSVDHFEIAKQTLTFISDKFIYCGGLGSGQITKLLNNYLANCLYALVTEALLVGKKHGLPLESLSQALQHGTGQSWVLDELFPNTLFQGDFRPGLSLKLAKKDMQLMDELASSCDVNLTYSKNLSDLMDEAMRRGWAGETTHSFVKLIEEKNKDQLRFDYHRQE